MKKLMPMRSYSAEKDEGLGAEGVAGRGLAAWPSQVPVGVRLHSAAHHGTYFTLNPQP